MFTGVLTIDLFGSSFLMMINPRVFLSVEGLKKGFAFFSMLEIQIFITHALRAISRKTLAETDPFCARLTQRKFAIETSETVNGSKNVDIAPCKRPPSLKKDPLPCASPSLSNKARCKLSFLMLMGVGVVLLLCPNIIKTSQYAVKRSVTPFFSQSGRSFGCVRFSNVCTVIRITAYV